MDDVWIALYSVLIGIGVIVAEVFLIGLIAKLIIKCGKDK